LLFVGDGEHAEDRQRIIDRATSLGIREYVEITGFLPRDAALRRIMQVDIALSPFFPTMVLNSTSPTKLVEYLALGLAVVANRHPEQRAILRATRSGVCVPWQPRHFARAALWIAKQTDAVRTRMAERGRTWVVQNRDYARIADAVEQKYAELLH
jgi:glycosyltransferase involved in cell wall biosynthesis